MQMHNNANETSPATKNKEVMLMGIGIIVIGVGVILCGIAVMKKDN